MTSKKRRRVRWTEAKARGVLKDLAECGLSVEAFMRSRGVTRHKLEYWKERLAERPAVAFVPVALPERAAARPGTLDILVGSIVVRVREDLDVERVAKLVRALSGDAPSC